jgi:hypothetical protein
MTDELVPNLSFGSSETLLPQTGQLLLITDHLAASAEFVLHRALHSCLRTRALADSDAANTVQRVVLVSLSRDLVHWRAIASKAGVNLGQHLKAGSLAFVDGLAISAYTSGTQQNDRADEVGCTRCPPLFLVDGVKKSEPSLKGLYDVIQKALLPTRVDNETDHSAAAAGAATIVMIDDITLLSFIGISDTAITRFIRALRALCRRHSAGLIIRAHASAAPVPHNAESSIPFGSGILRALVESSYRHVEVRPLASGRSGAISGEVAVHLGGLGSGDGGVEGGRLGRGTAVHYRLNDSGATFFQKGMSAGIL